MILLHLLSGGGGGGGGKCYKTQETLHMSQTKKLPVQR